MKLITIDFETYYDKDYSLSKMTTEEYVRDAWFEVIGIGVKVDDGDTHWASGSFETLKLWLHESFDWSNAGVLAHNTMFDGAILGWLFGIKPKVWFDTLSMARALHGPDAKVSLAALAQRHGLGVKGTEVVNALGKRRADFSDTQLATYGDYCINDVELTYELFLKLLAQFPKQELRVIDLTLRMFIEPRLELDMERLETHLTETLALKDKLLAESGATRDDLMSNNKFADMLRSLGVEPPMKISPTTGKPALALAKSDEEFTALAEHPDVRVQTLVAARLGNKSTLEETRTQRFLNIAKRGKLPVPLRYYAAHTGRWGGDDKLNLQNLPSRGQNANKLKTSIKAPPGYVLIDSDSAQIEARVLAWWAEQDDLVDAFREGKDVYVKMASAIYGKPESDITKQERFVGKSVVLGCFGPDTQVLTKAGWKRIVEVQLTDTLWDGEEWVSHRGLVPKGVRTTIRAWGVDATPEHEILTGHGWREWHEVATNHTLFQSALSKVSLPSSIGSSITNQLDVLRGGTLSSGALVDGKGRLIATTSRLGVQRDVTPVQKMRQQPLGKNIGDMKTYSQMWRTVSGYSTELQASLHDAIQRLASYTPPMAGVGYLCTSRGALTAEPSYAIYLHSLTGTNPLAKLTGWITTKVTNRVIYDLPHGQKTSKTDVKLEICKKKLMTYDIAYAGPRNRFTIATTAGPIIVHNCGYGMGAARFQAQLKLFGVEVDLDECRRIIDIYRQTNPRIVQLWRQAQEVLICLSRGEHAPLGKPGVVATVPEETAVRLPSGLLLRYDDLSFAEGAKGIEFSYKTRKGRTRIYGGKVVENLCQALARCIIAEQMLRISKRYPVVMTVHDSVVCLAPESEVEGAISYVEESMRWVPSWAEGLPVNCEADVGVRYGHY